MAFMKMKTLHRLIPVAAMALTVVLAPAWAARGRIAAFPNPCHIEPGAQQCTTYLNWSTEGVEHARVYVRIEGRRAAPEKEFGTGANCERCGASWIEEGSRYLFTLVDFTRGQRGEVLANVEVTAVVGGRAEMERVGDGDHDGGSAEISAAPNPCRVRPGRSDCATFVRWRTTGIDHVRVYVVAEGERGAAEKEFASAHDCERCEANWIAPRTRYTFTIYKVSPRGRERALGSVVVTGVD